MSTEKINKEDIKEQNNKKGTTPDSQEETSNKVEDTVSSEKDEAKPKKKAKKKNKDKELIAELENKNKEAEDRYIRLSAEFDNYRKRTLKERMELTKSAGESVLLNILPVIDDFNRAIQSMADEHNESAIKDGIELIFGKFNDFLKQNGVSEIEAKGKEFDTDIHEAITKIPAPEEKLKGKVVDVIQKGYSLNDKVIRFAKVVIGE
jgi:molecular chaperone GrpE